MPTPEDVGGWPGWKTLLGGVVHDFNNLLQVIIAMAAMIRHTLGADHPAYPQVEVIEQCALRAAALGQKLRSFTSAERLSRGLLDLNGLLKDASRVLRAILPPPSKLEVSAAERPVWVVADPSELLRTILDLCSGAFHAAESGGTLRLALEHTEAAATSCIHLSVDAGTAEAAPARQRAAEVLLSHGGRLEVVQGEARRVEFGLTLPTVRGSDPAGGESPETVGSHMNDAMRELLSGMLRELGCVVLKVSKPSESETKEETI